MEYDLYGYQRRMWNMFRNHRKLINEYIRNNAIMKGVLSETTNMNEDLKYLWTLEKKGQINTNWAITKDKIRSIN